MLFCALSCLSGIWRVPSGIKADNLIRLVSVQCCTVLYSMYCAISHHYSSSAPFPELGVAKDSKYKRWSLCNVHKTSEVLGYAWKSMIGIA